MYNNKIKRSSTDYSIAGVCGGIAEYYHISSLAVRIIFLCLPCNLLIYIILANTLPVSFKPIQKSLR
ncbi:phage shock protein PspC (stress-responsive transcriptional regulator) [Gracilibacillus halotolerans]|uniref:Phage shock protein PspC (Stress-responsive transcriptional regulator) n=1 Tax=Gracilibacillus halotolerans TaxID=74386 RepID=A0A841RME0_9BACI|nr:PspC domain-containing protein [Gracilibacillus halotolerans]MBB6513082.1 phage shock protein PspC (stress-responsive transcriptional regulator) [Gracilibacillus halotolerans]